MAWEVRNAQNVVLGTLRGDIHPVRGGIWRGVFRAGGHGVYQLDFKIEEREWKSVLIPVGVDDGLFHKLEGFTPVGPAPSRSR